MKFKSFVLLSLALCLVCSLFAGCDLFEAEEKTFKKGDHFAITLNEDFSKGDADTYEGSYAFYKSEHVHVMVMHESYEELEIEEDDMTLDEYIEAMLEVNNRSTATVKEANGYKFITYSNLEDGETMFYKVAFYKGAEGFYAVNFITPMVNMDKYAEKFDAWAESVDVD